MTLDSMLNTLAEHAPEGVYVEITVERGSGYALLVRDGFEEAFACDYDRGLSGQVEAILDHLGLGNRCEHGVRDGDWCEPCSKERKRAEAEFIKESLV